jgi:sarcosine oxidase subunit gamma
MAEPVALRRTPAIPATPGLRLLPPAARFILRADGRALGIAGTVLGIEDAPGSCRASQAGSHAALWLGPDEYLLLAPEAEAPALVSCLEQALQGEPHSLVDVSQRQAALELSGSRAADILSSGCPLDLDVTAFPVGMCTRSVFAKAEIVLWRTAGDTFRLEVWRSFTDYVACYLDEVVREYAGSAK